MAIHFKKWLFQLDDEPNLYHGKMVGNHHFHPLKTGVGLGVPGGTFLTVFQRPSFKEGLFRLLLRNSATSATVG